VWITMLFFHPRVHFCDLLITLSKNLYLWERKLPYVLLSWIVIDPRSAIPTMLGCNIRLNPLKSLIIGLSKGHGEIIYDITAIIQKWPREKCRRPLDLIRQKNGGDFNRFSLPLYTYSIGASSELLYKGQLRKRDSKHRWLTALYIPYFKSPLAFGNCRKFVSCTCASIFFSCSNCFNKSSRSGEYADGICRL
jgi:hypothetical protein